MLYHTSRSDLQPYISAGHQARSRALFDLITLTSHAVTNAWAQIRRAVHGKFGAHSECHDHPSSAMHA